MTCEAVQVKCSSFTNGPIALLMQPGKIVRPELLLSPLLETH